MDLVLDSFCYGLFLWNPPPPLPFCFFNTPPPPFPFTHPVSLRDPGSGPGSVTCFHSVPRKSFSQLLAMSAPGKWLNKWENYYISILFNLTFRQKMRRIAVIHLFLITVRHNDFNTWFLTGFLHYVTFCCHCETIRHLKVSFPVHRTWIQSELKPSPAPRFRALEKLYPPQGGEIWKTFLKCLHENWSEYTCDFAHRYSVLLLPLDGKEQLVEEVKASVVSVYMRADFQQTCWFKFFVSCK